MPFLAAVKDIKVAVPRPRWNSNVQWELVCMLILILGEYKFVVSPVISILVGLFSHSHARSQLRTMYSHNNDDGWKGQVKSKVIPSWLKFLNKLEIHSIVCGMFLLQICYTLHDIASYSDSRLRIRHICKAQKFANNGLLIGLQEHGIWLGQEWKWWILEMMPVKMFGFDDKKL